MIIGALDSLPVGLLDRFLIETEDPVCAVLTFKNTTLSDEYMANLKSIEL